MQNIEILSKEDGTHVIINGQEIEDIYGLRLVQVGRKTPVLTLDIRCERLLNVNKRDVTVCLDCQRYFNKVKDDGTIQTMSDEEMEQCSVIDTVGRNIEKYVN